MADQAHGKVKWFDNKKGYGFVERDNGEQIFVHHTGIAGKGYKTLNQGDEISFEIVPGNKGMKAEKVIVTKAAATA